MSQVSCISCLVFQQTLDTGRLVEFHGTGALNMTRFPTWDSVFVDLVNRPVETVIVEIKRRGRSHRGWSNNQYLENLNNGGGNVTRSKENPYMEEVSRYASRMISLLQWREEHFLIYSVYF